LVLYIIYVLGVPYSCGVVFVFWFWREIVFGVTYVLSVQYSCGLCQFFCCDGKANLVRLTLFYSTLLALTHGHKDRQRNKYTRFVWAGGTFFPVVLLCQFSVLAGNRFWFYILLMYLEYHTVVVLC
jgi:hypothetical protein